MPLTTALMCLAMNVYHEARGEPIDGQIAVAYVTHHRARHDPKNYCAEVYRKGQFSWTAKKTPQPVKESPEWKTAVAVARTFLIYPDPTHGATHYHDKKSKPPWKKTMVAVAHIGGHVFYKERHG